MCGQVSCPQLYVSQCVPQGLGCVTVCDCDCVRHGMPLKPPFLGGFDVVEFLGAVRTPASLLRLQKMAVLSAQRGKTHFPLTLALSCCLEDRPACFPIFTA